MSFCLSLELFLYSFSLSAPSQSFLLLTTCVELMDCFGWAPAAECHLISVLPDRSSVRWNVIGCHPTPRPLLHSPPWMGKCACIIKSIVSLSLSLHRSLFLCPPPCPACDGYKRTVGQLPQPRPNRPEPPPTVPRHRAHSCKWAAHSANQVTIHIQVACCHCEGEIPWWDVIQFQSMQSLLPL